jgi:hypothetical protein
MIIHIVPFPTFAAGRTIDIVQAVATGHVMAMPPGRIGQSNNYAADLDGFVTFTNQPNEPAHGYAQLFRSGAVEGVTLLSTDEKTQASYLAGPVFEHTAGSCIKNYLMFIKDIDLGFPVFVFLFLRRERLCAVDPNRIRGRVLRCRTPAAGCNRPARG